MSELLKPSSEGTPSACLPPHLNKRRFRGGEAQQYLEIVHGVPVSVSTLAKLRSIGGGPRFEKFGHTPLYPREELDAWAIAKLGNLRASTSDEGGSK